MSENASYLAWRKAKKLAEATSLKYGLGFGSPSTGPASRKDIPLPDSFKCRVCQKVKGKNLFSKKEHTAWQNKVFVNPGRQYVEHYHTIICRVCFGQPLVEMFCNGPCHKVLSLDDFAKNQRNEVQPWCADCIDWKSTNEPVYTPIVPPAAVVEDPGEVLQPVNLGAVDDVPEELEDPVKQYPLIDLSTGEQVITERDGWSVIKVAKSVVSSSAQDNTASTPAVRVRLPAGKRDFPKIPNIPAKPLERNYPGPRVENLDHSEDEGEYDDGT